MRTEKEIYDLVLNFAFQDERIRIVTLEGSRTNVNIPKDNGLEKPSIVLLEQIHTIDKQRLQKFIGKASDKALAGIEYALAISLGFIDPVTKTTEIGLCSTCKDLLSHAGAFSIEDKKITCTCSRCGFPKGTVYKMKQKGGS